MSQENPGGTWGTSEQWNEALDTSAGISDEGTGTESEAPSQTPEVEGVSVEASASSSGEEAVEEVEEVENPYAEETSEASSEDEEPVVDHDQRRVENLKAELDRKMANRDKRLEELSGQNQQLVGVIQELRQMLVDSNQKPEPPAKDPYAHLDKDDPDYDLHVMRVDLQKTRDELSRMKSEKQDEVRRHEQQQRQANYQNWVQNSIQGFVETATKGTRFEGNNEVKSRLWEAGYTHLGAVGADPNRIDEVGAAVSSAFRTFDSIYKQAQEAAVGKVKNRKATRKPIKSTGATKSVKGTPPPSPAKMSKKEFETAVDAWINSNVPS
tara:strand:- start:2285 stop:3259 length:975 start_codon:yes stop_codon:yes gene_type:complete